MIPAVKFTYRRPYRAAAIMTAREAVLSPTTRPVSSDRELYDAMNLLAVRWRHAAEQLFEHGWRPHNSPLEEVARERLRFLLNCRPPFAEVAQQTMFCKQTLICPYCYARRIATLYTNLLGRLNLLDEAPQTEIDLSHEVVNEAEPRRGRRRTVRLDLDGRQVTAAVRLIERRHEFNVPLLDTPECYEAATRKVPDHGVLTLTDVFQRRPPQQMLAITTRLQGVLAKMCEKRRETVEKIQPLGSVLYTTVEPWERCWHLEHRQLFIVREDYTLPAEVQERTEGVIRTYDNVNAKAVSLAIRRTFAYPQRLLLGDHGLTAAYLNARAGRRMWASTGTMRNYFPGIEADEPSH